MAWRQTSRHARPKGRSSLKAAYADLQAELGDVRRHRYADTLENTRLTALVDALTVQVSRLQGELSAVRVELAEARSTAAQRDPYVEVLAAEATELRGAVQGQAILLQTLTARIGELLERDRARDEAAAAEQVPAAVVETPAEQPEPASPYPGAATAPEPALEHEPEPVVHLAEPVEALVPSLGDDGAEVDDLAMLRLRLIRAQAAAAVVQPAVPSSATP